MNLRVELLHLNGPLDDQTVMECSDFHLIDEFNVSSLIKIIEMKKYKFFLIFNIKVSISS